MELHQLIPEQVTKLDIFFVYKHLGKFKTDLKVEIGFIPHPFKSESLKFDETFPLIKTLKWTLREGRLLINERERIC